MTRTLPGTAIALLATTAHATSVQNTSGIADPTATITFSEVDLLPGTRITDQYAALGASFSDFAIFRPQDGFFATDYIGNFEADGTAWNPLEIAFSQVVGAAAFQYIGNPGTTTFEALLRGAVVGSFTAAASSVPGNWYGFQGLSFDAIRITSPANGSFEMDDLQFRTAVPEPAPIALLAAGMAIAGLRARRRR